VCFEVTFQVILSEIFECQPHICGGVAVCTTDFGVSMISPERLIPVEQQILLAPPTLFANFTVHRLVLNEWSFWRKRISRFLCCFSLERLETHFHTPGFLSPLRYASDRQAVTLGSG